MIEKEYQSPPIYTHVLIEVRDKFKNQEPIRRGCVNAQCFCSGACQEIVGWRDKQPDNFIGDLFNNEKC